MSASTGHIRDVVGVMTGTSIDGMDAALVRITGSGLSMRAELIAHAAQPLGELEQPLRQLAEGKPMRAESIARTAWAFGERHAELIQSILDEQARPDAPALIAVHGQTVFHQPPISWQLLNPAPIAARFASPVVSDLRQADLAAGGQGAPITPIADWIMFRHSEKSRAIVNLGGFCNITVLPAEDTADARKNVTGFDLCVCNQLLDAIARRALDQPYDDRGRAALAGNVDDAITSELLRILNEQHAAHRSLGTGDACGAWLEQHLDALAGPDLAASAVRAVGRCINDRLRTANVDELILAGGGARNEALVNTIRDSSPGPVAMSDDLGIPAEAREAAAMAILGVLCADGVPITLPRITGCRQSAPRAGSWLRAVADERVNDA